MKIRKLTFFRVEVHGSKELQFKGVLPCRGGCEESQGDEYKVVERGRKGKISAARFSGTRRAYNYAVDAEI